MPVVNSDRTPLHKAARKGHIDVVRLLVENGADVNARDVNATGRLCMRPLRESHIDVV